MMTSKPSTPPPTTSAAVTKKATILVNVPPPQPSSVNTVEVASVESETSTVSQPTSRIQESAVGSALPVTPKAARLSTIVGAEPRLPARATTPHRAKDRTTPITPATVACQNDSPKPTTNEP